MKRKPKWTPVEFFKCRDGGQWYWRLVARNGRVVADGAEGYSSEAKCRQGFKAAQKLMAATP
jgi:uncharacterized protein YegP (UPF0339 family)